MINKPTEIRYELSELQRATGLKLVVLMNRYEAAEAVEAV